MNVWNKVLRHIEGRINPGSFDTWFKPTSFIGVRDDVIRVQVPNERFRDWLTHNYSDLLSDAVERTANGARRIEFEVQGGAERYPRQATAQRVDDGPAVRRAPGLNPKYTFDSFVVGSFNQFAHAAARAVAQEPSRVYNPLYIYGGVGLGKTHLMHAIGHHLLQSGHGMRLAYISSEAFMNELVNSIRYDRTEEFRERYRSIDILLMDDIQFLAGKERTQEEFFHTFNALHGAQKQIVISSDCPPRAIPTLEERLRSRFEWGLIADIQPPDLETKIAILKKKAEAEKVMLADDVVMYLAGKIKSNIRELEGALIRLIACASLTGRRVDLAFAKEILDSAMPEGNQSVSVDQIIKVVAEFYGLKANELKSRTNRHAVAHPRQVAMYLSKKLTGMSFPQIGRVFGGKHHTTVMHSVNVVDERMGREPEFHKTVHSLMQSLQ